MEPVSVDTYVRTEVRHHLRERGLAQRAVRAGDDQHRKPGEDVTDHGLRKIPAPAQRPFARSVGST